MPDYIQFEPVDATDVVNLNTGNFSYTIPLSEIPGPYGNFPLNMSYHAGIGPNQEGTLVGLGWSLNAGGAINRTLRGTPDDQFHGGDLSFIYAYSSTSMFSVDATLSFGPVGLNMSYNSYSGYGLNANVSIQYGPYTLGSNFGTSGVGISGGVGWAAGGGTLGITGSIGLSADGTFDGSVGVGYTSAGGVSIEASVGVAVNDGGDVSARGSFGLTANNVHVGFSTEGIEASYGGVGVSAGPGGVSVSASYNGIGGSINLSSHGYSVGISVQGTGLAVSAASSSTSNSHTNTASIVVPGLFGYSRTNYQTWVRQATSEHSYGYMYQAGPAIAVDGKNEDYSPVAAGGSNNNGSGGDVPWDWSFKGRSLDHVGDPTQGSLLTGYDVFDVAAQGVNGAFRATSLTTGQIHMSVEGLGSVIATGDPAKGSENLDESAAPNALFYLLKPKPITNPNYVNASAHIRQETEDFSPAAADLANPQLTHFAYDYCHDDSPNADPENLNYLGDETSAANRLEKVTSGICSRFAILKSNYLNEGGRLLYSTRWNKNAELDFNRKFRSRMVFTFMGENGGYFESEDDIGTTKKGRDELPGTHMKKTLREWNGGANTRQDPIWGARKIEPILEGNSNVGRLQGFKITNPDGTQFFFTQPVRSLMSAAFTTNQPKGGPAFIDRHNPRENEDWTDILAQGWRTFIKDPTATAANLGRWAGRLAVNSVSSFLFYSPVFTTKCDEQDKTSTYNYSYSMSTNPYATQWLLSEVRGPDFVEFDPLHMEKNFGYQVKLHYTDVRHYAWRTPYAPPGMGNEELPNLRLPRNGVTADNCLSELYHSSFGVKELVYLESIETSTHRAIFHLNDTGAATARKDARGWVFDWKGRTENILDPAQPGQTKTHVREGIPIMVGTNFPIQKSVGSETSMNGLIYRLDTPKTGQNPQTAYTQAQTLSWKRRTATYSLNKVFLDIQPTNEQIQKMLGKTIVVTGYNDLATHKPIGFKAPPPIFGINSTYVLYDGIYAPPYPAQISVTPGYNLPKAPVTPNSFTGVVQSIERATGTELQYGSYAIVFTQSIPLGTQDVNYDFHLANNEALGNYVSNFDPVANPIPDMDPAVPLKLTSGGGDFKGKTTQTLLVFNEFIDFNDEEGGNQMRRLDSISIVDKQFEGKPLKRFVFNYSYDLQPNTLNSYDVPQETGILGEKHEQAYPLQRDPDDPLRPNPIPPAIPGSLLGKLTLNSVTEIGCGGENCAERASLPPFRFAYESPETTPFKKADNRDETIRQSSLSQDEWGFYNRDASLENNKAHWYSADAGGAAWSLNKIIDPSGGIMRVDYERDTYLGESYAEDDLALPFKWKECPSGNNKMCLDFLPRKWVVYCDRADRLRGEWSYTTQGNDQNMDYLLGKGFVPGSQVFFNLQQTLATEVGCGVNVGFWKSGGCARHRSISEVGTATIQTVTQTTGEDPLFDQAEYDAAKQAATENNHSFDPNPVCDPSRPGGGCCPYYPPGSSQSIGYLNAFWHCSYPVLRLQTDLPVTEFNSQYGHTADKLKKRDWATEDSRYYERFGVAWARQPNRTIKGGDIRVRDLIKYDIGLMQRSHYDYSIGQTAQYADSAFSVAFATRFSTGKITDLVGVDVPTMDPKFRNLPSQSRIPGIRDYDSPLLPGASISYPKVTLTNIVEDQAHHKTILNGKTEFEFHGPEQLRTFGIHIPSFQFDANVQPLNIFVDYYSHPSGGSLTRLDFPKDKLEPFALTQDPLTSARSYSYEGSRVDIPSGAQVKDIRMLKFTIFKDMASYLSGNAYTVDIYVKDAAEPGQWAGDLADLYLINGRFTGSAFMLSKDPAFGQSTEPGMVFNRFDFPQPILVRNEPTTSIIEFQDRTSRLGKAKSTTFFRKVVDAAHPDQDRFMLLKKDSMAYADVAPSVDTRFIPNADKSKVGRFTERWGYERVRKCDGTNEANDPDIPDCKDDDFESQWKPFGNPGLLGSKTVIHTRFPTFLVASQSKSGFNDSRQPGEVTDGHTDFITSSVTNHYFDPVTGQPTLSVAYTGPIPLHNVAGSPSKITRTTPAYLVDPDQQSSNLPNLMFAKNMIDQKFREDVFIFPTSTVKTEDDFNSATLLPPSNGQGNTGNGDNGGDLSAYLTQTKISPYQQKSVTQSAGELTLENPVSFSVTDPIVTRGDFAPRFDLAAANSAIPFNRNFFAVQPDLTVWNGSRITRVNRFFKALESEDAYQRSTTNWFSANGMHQIGMFSNARYRETAVLLPEDQIGLCSRPASASEDWTTDAIICPYLDGKLLEISYNSKVFHRFDAKPSTQYLVEWQGHVPADLPVTVAIISPVGQIAVQQTVTMHTGLDRYQATLSVPTGFSSVPVGGNFAKVSVAIPNGSTSAKFKYLRVYPLNASAVTYVYNEKGDMTQVVDVNNISTYYEYDLLGKLAAIRNDDGIILSAGSREQPNK